MRIRSRLLTRLLGATAALVCRLLFLTCRKRWRLVVDGTNPYADTGEQRFLYCIWHDQIVMTVFFNRPHRVAALADREVPLYSDFLLHDMGEYLADGIRQGEAGGTEWRTAPLWGLRVMREFLNGQALLLHDGRARSVEEAILLHGGEAQAARDAFQALSAEDRAALIDFVESR